jgi:UDP-N-acetylmuramyl pentapeptide phosphotransferase/UDP-N-acetylglucosamine-1-phosphate transferase
VTSHTGRRLLVAGVAAGAAHLGTAVVMRARPGGAARWQRLNFRQRPVDLAAGPGAGAGLTAGLVVSRSPAALLVTGAAAGLGLYDDLAGQTHARGLRGHLAALRAGTVTSGMVKMVGLAAAAALSAPARPRRPLALATDVVLIAGSANLVNLLDLRPGRALKVALASSLPLASAHGPGGDAAAAVAGVSLVLLPADLGEQRMLGDCGANALGAAVGWSMAARLRRSHRFVAAAAVVALTAASERVSFTSVIERNAALSAIDRWGRRTS